jgi:hypothetical protein
MEDNRIDTDLDSWNTGNDKADIMDNTKYNPEDVSDEAKEGLFVGDEGDEDDLGISDDTDDDLVKNLDAHFDELDDSEYDDSSFDCD